MHGNRDGHHWYASFGILMLDGGLVLGPVTGTCYSLFQNEISNIPTFTPSLFNQTRRITRLNVPVTRYKSVIKNGHDWSPASTALTKLKPIWRDNNIFLGSKVKLMRSLVISIFLYACESWTLTAELEKRTQAFEMRCYRRLLNILYKDHVTNEEVRRKIQEAIGEYDELLTLVKKRKLRWFGHVSRSSGLAKTILQGTVKGKIKRGRQKKR